MLCMRRWCHDMTFRPLDTFRQMGPCVSLRTALCPKIWCCRGPNLDQALLKRTLHEVSFFFWNFGQLKHIVWVGKLWELSQDPMINSNLPQNFSNKTTIYQQNLEIDFLFNILSYWLILFLKIKIQNQDSLTPYTVPPQNMKHNS